MPSLLVIGAVALDRPIRLGGPLRPGARLRASSLAGGLEGRLGGGAANAGCALLAAGHRVLVASFLADDADGRRALALAGEAGLDLRLTQSYPGASAKTILLIEPDGERTILGLDLVLPATRPALPSPSAFPDLRPEGLFIRMAFDGAADWARRCAGPVLLHGPSPAYDGEADVLVASADDLPPGQAAAPFEAASARLGPRLSWVVVTQGAGGAIAHGPHGRQVAARPPPAVVRDATGAGDAFAAGLLDALVAGAEMERALAHACAWGAAAVGVDASAPTEVPPDLFRPFSGQALAQLA